jgi:hypothetical protein
MDRKEVLAAVETKLLSQPRFKACRVVDRRLGNAIIDLEEDAEEESAKQGFRIINQGVQACFLRHVQMVLVTDGDPEFIESVDHLMQLRSVKGDIIGEWVSERNREKMRKRKDIWFVSDDFVMYEGKDLHGGMYMTIGEIDFPFLKGVEGIKNLTSGSLSSASGALVLKELDYTDKDWTHLIGFDLADDVTERGS